jgi:uncharacterized protein DUF6748
VCRFAFSRDRAIAYIGLRLAESGCIHLIKETDMRSLLPLLAFVPLWTGCAAATASDPDLDDESAIDDDVVAADSPYASSYRYFKIVADLRKCPSPGCGGWFVQRLNRTQTRCYDGTYGDSCYTAWLDWTQAKLGDANKDRMLQACEQGARSESVVAIVRGMWRPFGDNERYSSAGTFQLAEAWVAEPNSASDGVFVRIRDNGIRCIVAPCPHLDEARLNSTTAHVIDELDFSVSRLDERTIDALVAATESPDGIVVAGHRYEVYDNGHGGLGRTVTAGYRRLVEPTCDPAGNCH